VVAINPPEWVLVVLWMRKKVTKTGGFQGKYPEVMLVIDQPVL
jgi:hypothetical protein